MQEEEVFGYLDGGSITIEDRRSKSTTKSWCVYFTDDTDIEIQCYGGTKDDAWSKACTELLSVIHEREKLALEAHPSETAGERNPSL
jgi:hypothetical protein